MGVAVADVARQRWGVCLVFQTHHNDGALFACVVGHGVGGRARAPMCGWVTHPKISFACSLRRWFMRFGGWCGRLVKLVVWWGDENVIFENTY